MLIIIESEEERPSPLIETRNSSIFLLFHDLPIQLRLEYKIMPLHPVSFSL